MPQKKIHLFLLFCALAASGPVTLIPAAHAQEMAAQPQANNLQLIFDAVDKGDIRGLADYLNFVKTFPSLNPHLIENGKLNLHFTDQEGNTPLIRAARKNNLDMVRFLLSNGADINAVNSYNESALITSYTYQQFAISNYLLVMGASDPYYIAQLLQTPAAPVAPRIVAAQQPAAAPIAPPPEQEAIAAVDPTKNPGDLSPSAGPGIILFGMTQKGLFLVGGSVLAAAGAGGATALATASASSFPPPVLFTTVAPRNGSPFSFRSAEAAGMEGIYDMNADYSLAHGYDGSIYGRNVDGSLISSTPTGFVKVAVVDSGIQLDHPDLVDNILASAAVTCNDVGCVAGGNDTEGHGTTVAGIIAAQLNGVGMHGVAPKAQLLAIGFADNAGALTNGDAPGISSALDNGAQVINGSYGFEGLYAPTADATGITAIQDLLNTSYGGTDLMTQFQRGVAAHAIFVYAAGNESSAGQPVGQPAVPASLPYFFRGAVVPAGVNAGDYNAVNPSGYDWSENWIAAVSVYKDSDNVFRISDFSNQCGAAMDWCLAAPGEISNSTSNDGGYSGAIQGTSFSAPNISGAAAALLGAFPHLTPEKIVLILFETATDLGPAGVDTIYGHGLVNLDRATDPSDGDWQLAAAAVMVPFARSGMGLSAPFGNALASNHATLMFLDHYGKNYTIPLSTLARTLAPIKTDYDRLVKLATPDMDKMMTLGENTTLSFSTSAGAGYSKDTPQDKMAKFSYASSMAVDAEGTRTASFAFNYKTSLAEALAPAEQRMITSDALKNPYLALVETSNSSVVSYQDGPAKITTATYMGKQDKAKYDYKLNESKQVSGVHSEVTYAKGAATISLTNGIAMEDSTLLGSETGGAFSVDGATTYYTGLSGRYLFGDNAAIIANYNIGYTEVATSGNSLLNDVSGIVSSSFAAGGEFYNVAGDGDTLGFIISQPLRVNQGNAALTLPVGITSNGTILRQNGTLNLTPTGRELDFEIFYNVKQDDYSELSLDSMFRLNPNNDPTATNDATFLAKYKIKM